MKLLLSDTCCLCRTASTIQPIVDLERGVFYRCSSMACRPAQSVLLDNHAHAEMHRLCRERSAGYYASYPYALAQALVEIPYLVVQAFLFSFIVYFMVSAVQQELHADTEC